jgi:hypothetical protein
MIDSRIPLRGLGKKPEILTKKKKQLPQKRYFPKIIPESILKRELHILKFPPRLLG